MTKKFMEMAFTEAVRDIQAENGSADHYDAAMLNHKIGTCTKPYVDN